MEGSKYRRRRKVFCAILVTHSVVGPHWKLKCLQGLAIRAHMRAKMAKQWIAWVLAHQQNVIALHAQQWQHCMLSSGMNVIALHAQ